MTTQAEYIEARFLEYYPAAFGSITVEEIPHEQIHVHVLHAEPGEPNRFTASSWICEVGSDDDWYTFFGAGTMFLTIPLMPEALSNPQQTEDALPPVETMKMTWWPGIYCAHRYRESALPEVEIAARAWGWKEVPITTIPTELELHFIKDNDIRVVPDRDPRTLVWLGKDGLIEALHYGIDCYLVVSET